MLLSIDIPLGNLSMRTFYKVAFLKNRCVGKGKVVSKGEHYISDWFLPRKIVLTFSLNFQSK